MRSRRLLSPRHKSLVMLLFVVSLILFAAPRSWTHGLLTAVQFVIPAQYAVQWGTDAVAGGPASDGMPPGAEECARLANERRGQEHLAAALAARVADLQREVELLTATRLWNVDGLSLGSSGRLVPADVLGGDVLAWRDSAWIDTGSVRRGDAVVSRTLEVGAGTAGGVQAGLAVLLGESLVGFVDAVGTHSSRVKLVSDTGSGMKVRIGRMVAGRLVSTERYYWMTGQGQGRMRVGDVVREDVDRGRIAAGDLVLSDPMLGALPAPMVVGTVTDCAADRENPLLAVLEVRSAVEAAGLRRVYVYDPRGAP